MKYVREAIATSSPPSVALSGLERYISGKQYVLRLNVPLKALGLPSELGISQAVRVNFSAKRRSPLVTGRGNEGMSLEWAAEGGGPFPAFQGTLILRPHSGGTELELKGEYTPPLGEIGAAFDAVIGNKIAHATIRILLENLKSALEEEFAAFKEAIQQTR